MQEISVVRTVTTETFEAEVLQYDGVVVVDFWGLTCAPCKMLAPMFEKQAVDNPELKFLTLLVEENLDVARQYQLRAVPTFIIFFNGKEQVRYAGATEFVKLVTNIQALNRSEGFRKTFPGSQPNTAEPDEGNPGPTQQDQLVELLNSFGLRLVVSRTTVEEEKSLGRAVCVNIEEGDKVQGRVDYYFDRNGKFLDLLGDEL